MTEPVTLIGRLCPKCSDTKDMSDFHKGAFYCKDCVAKAGEARRRAAGAPVRNKVIAGHKVCTVCKERKPVGDFYKNKVGDNFFVVGQCKPCYNKVSRDRELVTKYGISREYYNGMLAVQGGGCAICHQPPNGKDLAVDHNHNTGVVRGLLCCNCNRGLGHLQDSSDMLLKAADYLKRHGS